MIIRFHFFMDIFLISWPQETSQNVTYRLIFHAPWELGVGIIASQSHDNVHQH